MMKMIMMMMMTTMTTMGMTGFPHYQENGNYKINTSWYWKDWEFDGKKHKKLSIE